MGRSIRETIIRTQLCSKRCPNIRAIPATVQPAVFNAVVRTLIKSFDKAIGTTFFTAKLVAKSPAILRAISGAFVES